MLFNSFNFLVFFFVVTIGYFVLPHRYRWLLLLVASCFFYMSFVPYYILILFVTIVIDYFAGILIERSTGRRRVTYLWLSIVSTCLVLFVFKYYNFFIDNVNGLAAMIGWNYALASLKIILPIGLSFHTFQSLSYVIEVYRGNQRAESNFGIYSLYVMYYPQLVAGPIERPQNLLYQFRRVNNFKYANFYRGLRLVVVGFFMKLVVADRLAIYVDAVYNNAENHSGVSLAFATVFFSFQIYCDFAGYSAIAIGVSRIMGIKLMTNFRRPYFAESVSEFWRRWHISLSTWFKDYVYVSLGGSRRGKWRTRINLMITFLISGFWHGANWTYVVWGGLNGLYLIVESSIVGARRRRAARGVSLLRSMFVFVLISFSWIFFRSATVGDAWLIVVKIMAFSGKLFIPDNVEMLIYCVVAILMLVVLEVFYELIYQHRLLKVNSRRISDVMMLFMIVTIVLMGVFDGGQFIYFQF